MGVSGGRHDFARHGERPLARSSAGTLHHQLFETLSELIRSGVFKPGDRLPTDEELVEQYLVSRTTVRRAVDELRRAGIVERTPGRGTFVLHPPVDAAIPYLHTVEEEIRQLGYTPGIIPLSVEESPAPEQTASYLRIDPGAPILRVKRVRTADGQPVYVAQSELNVTKFPTLQEADFGREAMYRIFERATGLATAKAVQWLSAVSATKEIAELLNMRRGDPVLKLERIVYMEGDQPIAVVTGHFRGEFYKSYSESYPRPV